MVLESGFPVEHLGVCVASYIDTRYREREAHIDAICDAIVASYRARPGNYLVFFSAYYFMQQVQQRFAERYAEIETRLQQRDAGEAEQQEFLQHFFAGVGQLGFVIMGGRFAEGIDYRGDALIGAIVVGAGLPQVSSEQQLIQQDFRVHGNERIRLRVSFPGPDPRQTKCRARNTWASRIAAWWCYSSGVFAQSAYAQHLPRWWQPQYCNNLTALEQALRNFWDSQQDLPPTSEPVIPAPEPQST